MQFRNLKISFMIKGEPQLTYKDWSCLLVKTNVSFFLENKSHTSIQLY